ncbi:DUF1579 family protein [Sphingobacterium faecium]|jgi:hypothetical protein|uniref:DUF1579 family protein n=1 Tax=Sphingobacterium faecium TaxID=34087 RepID=UPI00320926E1
MDQIAKQHLNHFIGTWDTEGIILETNNAPAIKIKGTDTYYWILDNSFLLHQANVMIGTSNSLTHEIIGYDVVRQHYSMQYYNNQGQSGFMNAILDNHLWTFTGTNLKFNGGFSKENNEFSGIWKQLNDHNIWSDFIHIKLTKR